MFRIVIKDVLVNFVRDRQNVELHTQITNQLQFRAGEHLAGWIIGSIEDDSFSVIVKSRSQLAFIEGPLAIRCARRTEFHEARPGATENRIRTIVLVERFENHDLIARVADREQRRDHGFS